MAASSRSAPSCRWPSSTPEIVQRIESAGRFSYRPSDLLRYRPDPCLANSKVHDQLVVVPIIDQDAFLFFADDLEADRLVQPARRVLRLRYCESDRADLR